jgi:hypothetical protein
MSKARTLASTVSNGAVLADGTIDAAEIGNLTLPTGGDIVGTTATQTLTGKTINIASNTLTGVQSTLVSGTSIKTVNGTTLLGSGDLEAGGGGQYSAIASGAIASAGLVVELNSDGTVSVVTGADVTVNTTVFNTPNCSVTTSTYDPVSNKVVLAFYDAGATQLKAIVGTVSGSTITFGTAVTFYSGNTGTMAIAYDVAAQRIVVAYRKSVGDNSVGGCRVGTVSGTSISFGPEVAIDGVLSVSALSLAYDAFNQKIVLFYCNSNPTANAKVGTISGSSISFGTAAAFHSTTISASAAAYDSVSQKLLVAFITDNYGICKVGTVSGTTISFGAEAYWSGTGVAPNSVSLVYATASGKFVVAYRAPTTTYGEARTITISGTTASLGTIVNFTGTNQVNYVSVTYDSANGQVLVTYLNQTGGAFGAAKVGTISGTAISFGDADVFRSGTLDFSSAVFDVPTSKYVINYVVGGVGNSSVFTPSFSNQATRIGIAQNAAANGAAVFVKVAGGVDENQSGLTVGSTYYVGNTGALTTTSTNNPRIGFALKPNTLLITDPT